MNPFHYQDNQLFAEQVPLSAIAEEFGTPCFVYSRSYLEQRYRAYETALGPDNLVCYAVKANSNLGVLSVLARLGSGFDIVSGGELARVIAAGGDPDKIIFSGVGKTAKEIQAALDANIHCFNVESVQELERINSIALERGVQAPVSLRINPDIDAGTHPYISTGLKENKFGIPFDNALNIYLSARDMAGITVTGVDCHIGSQLTEITPFTDALERVLSLLDLLEKEGISIAHLDLGGGLGVTYQDEVPPSPEELINAIREKLGPRNIRLILEPGRSICANAGVMLTRVEYIKANEDKNFIVVDGAMNDIIRPSLYQAWMEVVPVNLNPSSPAIENADLVGPICESADFLAKNRTLAASSGDLLAVKGAGAYCYTMSSNYNTRNRAAEVMVQDENCTLVRRRENYEDQMAAELPLSL